MHSASTNNIKFDQRVLDRIEQSVASIKALYHSKVLEICVFGSHARGTYKKFSTIDLLVIVQEGESGKRFLRRNAELQKILNEDDQIPQIDPLVYTHDELIDMIHKKESFILSMLRESIVVWSKQKEIKLHKLNENHIHHSKYSVAIPELKDSEEDD